MDNDKYVIDQARLNNDFMYHAPNEEQTKRYEQVRLFAKNYATFLMGNCPPSRELSLALTNLDQTVFWANASIARNE